MSRRPVPRRAWSSAGAAACLGLLLTMTGCSSPAAAPEPSATTDCGLARVAMDDYSTALTDLATSLEAGDAMSAVAAADAMSYALDQLETALPELPATGEAFLGASRSVALQVKQAAADSPDMPGLVGELTQAFADPAFAEGGDAIDAYVDQECPGTSDSGAP